ncbi:MAG: Trk system potassium transporter TrkA [bacterium]|nr:Trk system potassium transporter TrkA [bacterium]
METRRFVILGAGEVGRYLASQLSVQGHRVTVIDEDLGKVSVVEDQLDVQFVLGNGSHIPTLERARVEECDLFIAVSSSDEANLAAALLAKTLGAPRAVVRVRTSEDITRYGRVYERAFSADLLLSTQLLTTTQVLNHVLGYNTLEVEYVVEGAFEVRRTTVGSNSILARQPISAARLPEDSLVLALISKQGLTVPTGVVQAEVGDEVLVIATPESIDRVERAVSGSPPRRGLVVIAGGGTTATDTLRGFAHRAERIRVIEKDRATAERLAARFTRCEVIHGDATDPSLLAAEGVADASAFIALTGNDEANVMACLLAQDLGVQAVTALVQRTEVSALVRRFDSMNVVSPRRIAAERIQTYIETNYEPHVVSLENEQATFSRRAVFAQSPVVDCALVDVEIPKGLLIAAVMRNGRPTIPRGHHVLREGDEVLLFVAEGAADIVPLLFPGPEEAP